MPSKPKQKMPIEERAKQFMPFSALKGLEEALASKEKIIVPKKELTQDYAEELNLKLKSLKAGSIITVVYYCKEEYIKLTGMIAKINHFIYYLFFTIGLSFIIFIVWYLFYYYFPSSFHYYPIF